MSLPVPCPVGDQDFSCPAGREFLWPWQFYQLAVMYVLSANCQVLIIWIACWPERTGRTHLSNRVTRQLLIPRQHFELVIRRWRRQRPFESGGTGPPRVIRSSMLADKRVGET